MVSRLMFVAGIPIRNDLVADLAALLADEYYFKAARTLKRALDNNDTNVGLTIRERTAVLDVLDDPPAGTRTAPRRPPRRTHVAAARGPHARPCVIPDDRVCLDPFAIPMLFASYASLSPALMPSTRAA